MDVRGQQRRNETLESATDPEARRRRKTQTADAKGSGLGENLHGLIVSARVTRVCGRAMREAAVEMAGEIPGGAKRLMVNADRGENTKQVIGRTKDRKGTSHGAQKRERAAQCSLRADEAVRGLAGEPAEADTGRGIFRMGEGGTGLRKGKRGGRWDGQSRWHQSQTG